MQIYQILAPVWDFYVILLILVTIGLIFIGIPRKQKDDVTEEFAPRTLVMVPCRGLDFSLKENLESIKNQGYENYDVVAVVDTEDDPSAEILRELSIPVIVSSFKCTNCSGKTKALSTAIEQNPDYEAYVITDSDITVSKDWLKYLIAPLKNNKIGLSTTFPYFNPVGGFWSKVKAVWGIVGQSLMESDLTRFGWGGSLAFMKDLVDERSFLKFSESVSDDTALSSVCREKGLKISYSRRAQPTINSPDDFGTFFEWANRQTALSISATRRVFHYGVTVYVSEILVFLSAIMLSAFYSPLFLLLFTPTLLSVFNNARRSREIFPMLFLITLMLPFLFLINLLIANSMEEIRWRGRTYRLQKQKT